MRFLSLIILLTLSSPAAFAGGRPFMEPANNSSAKGGTISGQIKIPGQTASDMAMVFLFDAALGPPPSKDKYWRVPDNIVVLDQNGTFSIDLPPGTYYFIATKRDASSEMGPPQDGDYFYFNGDVEGNPLPLMIAKGTKLNIGSISGSYAYSRKALADKGVTAIEGLVVNEEGTPVPGVLVFASITPASQGRPLFVSERTGADGKFVMRVHDGGTFYLRVRALYGAGSPQDGEVLSSVAGDQPIMVTVRKQERFKGVKLLVRPFSRGQGSQYSDFD